MRRFLCLAPLLLATPAGAAGVSMGHEFLPSGMLMQDCMSRATQAVQSVGLELLRPTTRAVWAQTPDATQLYVLYCLPERGVVMVTGTAERADMVDPTVNNLRASMRNTGGGAGTGAAVGAPPSGGMRK